MKNIKRMIVLMFSLLLISCSTLLSKPITSSLDTWLGASEEELYMNWGPPHATQNISKELKIIVYYDSYYATTGGFMITDTWIPQSTTNISGKVILKIDNRGIIFGYVCDGSIGALRRIVRPRY